jgi:alpha-1,6-mannosyltransferase
MGNDVAVKSAVQERIDTGWPRAATIALGTAGAIGTSLIVVSGVTLGPHGPTGSAIERSVVGLVPTSAATPVGITAMIVGLILVLGAWILLGLLLRQGASLRPLFKIAAAWSAPIAIGPPLFSRDVYSYVAQGAMVQQHINPYTHGPGVLQNAKFLAPVSDIWYWTRCPYGPVFLRLAEFAVVSTGRSLLGAILVLRAVEIVGVILIAASLPTLARSVGKDPARAIWLGVCNPLLILHFIGGAHNDALMVGLLVAGLAVATTKRYASGVALCAVAACIKNPAAIGIAFIALEGVRAAPAGRRLSAFLRLSGTAVATLVSTSLVTGIGFGWLRALSVPGMNQSYLTPTTIVSHFVSDFIGHDGTVMSVTRALGMLVAAIGTVMLLKRASTIGTPRACGLALALIVACGPIVQPWYALWGIVIIAGAGRRIERGFAIFASVLLAITVEPSGSVMPDVVLIATVVTICAITIFILSRRSRTWIRTQLAPAIEEYRVLGRVTGVAYLVRLALNRDSLT